MVAIFWVSLMLLISFIFGIANGILSLYSDVSNVCSVLTWVAGVITYFAFFCFGFVIVASVLAYALQATGSFMGFILFMAVILITNEWVQYIPALGIRLYNKYILKLTL